MRLASGPIDTLFERADGSVYLGLGHPSYNYSKDQ
jgi:hypothetical protein